MESEEGIINPIEIDNMETNQKCDVEVAFDSKVTSDVGEVKEDSDSDNNEEQEVPREVKKLVAHNVGSDDGPAVHDEEEAEPTSSGRKRWKVKKFGF